MRYIAIAKIMLICAAVHPSGYNTPPVVHERQAAADPEPTTSPLVAKGRRARARSALPPQVEAHPPTRASRERCLVVRVGNPHVEQVGCFEFYVVDLKVLIPQRRFTRPIRMVEMFLDGSKTLVWENPGRLFKVLGPEKEFFTDDGSPREEVSYRELNFFGPIRRSEVAGACGRMTDLR